MIGTVKERMEHLKDRHRTVLETLVKAESATDALKVVNNKWLSYIRMLTAEEYRQELKRNVLVASCSDRLLEVLDKAREIVGVLKAHEQELKVDLMRFDVVGVGSAAETEPKSIATIGLPKMKLKNFSGDVRQWPHFWADFESAVESKPFDDMQKLNYLIGCLKGKAQKAVDGYAIVPYNYPVIVSLLKERFGNVEMLRQSYHSELKNLKHVERGKPLDAFVDDIERILKQLRNLGEDVNHPQIILTVEEKLPHWAQLEIYEAKTADLPWTTDKLCIHLRRIAKMQEAVEKISGGAPGQVPPSRQDERNQKQGTNPIYEKKPKKSQLRPCAFCAELHFMDKCTAYPTLQQRLARAQQLKLCHRCLIAGHEAFRCQLQQKQCYKCKQFGHHLALCPLMVKT